MRYMVRISGMIIGVVLGSAVLAALLNQFMSRYLAATGIDGGSVFVGLATMGLMAAVLTREAWLTA